MATDRENEARLKAAKAAAPVVDEQTKKAGVKAAPAKSTALTDLLAKNAAEKAVRDAASKQRKTDAITTTATKTAATAAAVRTFVRYQDSSRKGYRIPIYKDAVGQEFAGPEEYIGLNKDLDDEKSKDINSKTGSPTTSVDVLKAQLRGFGYPQSLIDSSTSFLNRLLSENLDYKSAGEIFIASKDYTFKDGTKVTSPFYEAYGFYNEGLKEPKTPGELYNAVEGYKGIATKYNLNAKFTSVDSIKKYVQNNVRVIDLDERANTARLFAVTSDPLYIEALKMQGFINTSENLTDFFLDPTIGKETLDQNRTTAAFTTEAIRAKSIMPKSGLSVDTEFAKKMGARLESADLTEAQVSATAASGFQNIGEALPREVGLSNVYEKENAATSDTIQKELQTSEFFGKGVRENERLKKLKELEERSYQAQSGNYTGRTTSYSNPSSAGLI